MVYRVERHPDYNGDKVILVDTQVLSAMAIGQDWDDELSFVVNRPFSQLRIKLNQQIYHETLGPAGLAGMKPAKYQKQRDFIETYRMNGKILLDDGKVPYFSVDRINLYQALFDAMNSTNISAEDLPIVVDAIVNWIPLLTWESNLPAGLVSAMKNRQVIKILKGGKLWTNVEQVLL